MSGFAIRIVGGRSGEIILAIFQIILFLDDKFFTIVGFSTFPDLYLLVNNTPFLAAHT